MSRGLDFDPCRQWLGIDAIDLTKPHLVLGVPRWETDPARIVTAADKRIRHLRGVDPGSFARARDALIARVEESRNAMLAGEPEGELGADDAAGPAESAQPVPPPLAGDGAAWAAVGATAPVWPAAGSPAVAGMDDAGDDAADDPFSVAPRPVAPRPVVYRRQRDSTAAWLAIVALLAVVAMGVALVAPHLRQPAVRKTEVAVRKSAPVNTPDRSLDSLTAPVSKLPVLEPVPQPPAEPPTPSPAPVEPPRPQPVAVTPPPAPVTPPPAPVTPPPAPVTPPPAPVTPPAPNQPPEMSPADGDLAANRQASQRLIVQAFSAIRGRRFDVATRSLDAAEDISQDDDPTVERINRWRQLVIYARDYPDYRDKALASMADGGEIEVGGDFISVIEVNPNLVIYRERGQTKRAPRGQLPERIEQAIVRKWFAADGRPANHLYLGAASLTRNPPDLQAARREWEIANRGGSEHGRTLLALLDDPAIQAARR